MRPHPYLLLAATRRILPNRWDLVAAPLIFGVFVLFAIGARQMSAPVPSPSMNGTMGFSGTWSLPFWIEILAPLAGAV